VGTNKKSNRKDRDIIPHNATKLIGSVLMNNTRESVGSCHSAMVHTSIPPMYAKKFRTLDFFGCYYREEQTDHCYFNKQRSAIWTSIPSNVMRRQTEAWTKQAKTTTKLLSTISQKHAMLHKQSPIETQKSRASMCQFIEQTEPSRLHQS